jgi:glucose/arabinose dehydrogenase
MKTITAAIILTAFLLACNNVVKKTASNPALPKPFETKSVLNFAQVVGWPADKVPSVINGFSVAKFADGLDNPRRIYQAPNGDIFVSEATIDTTILKNFLSTFDSKYQSMHFGGSANRITMFRDADGDGHYEERHVFLKGLNQPFGMLVLNNSFYVANTDGLVQYPYQENDTVINSPGKKILALPAGGYNNHWTRNVIANWEGTRLFITVGSGTNIAEHGLEVEKGRACILSVDTDGSDAKIYAEGLRNPTGMGWAPGTNTLWTTVNERDELGDELVPDYFTSVQQHGFYGWPFTYWGNHADPRVKEKNTHDPNATIVPDVSLGAHTASLGFAFDENELLPGKYKGGVLIAQHGSWNRSALSGYKIVFIPFKDGKPSGPAETFVDGFIAQQDPPKAYGRPVDVLITSKGKILITDDAANTIWCIQQNK